MSTTVACRIFMLVAALLLAPGLGLAQEKVPSEGTPPPPQTNLGTLPGTGCNESGGTNCPSDATPDDNPDNPVVSTFTFSGCTNIEDVNFGLNITHTWIGDLVVDVEGPSGTTVRLLDRPGRPGQNQNFGCNDNDVFAVLDDEGAEPAEDACPNTNATPGLSGELIPTEALSVFDGLSADGEWTLRVSDHEVEDVGNLIDWTLQITCVQQSDLAVEKTATVNEDATVDFAITVTNNGPADASGVEVTDPLPACVTYQSDDCGTGDGDPFTWTIGDLFVQGPPATCTVTVDASGCAGEGEQINAATVTADQEDPEPDNDSGEATFEITEAMSDLAVDKTATVNEDGMVDFAITVTNVGPNDATGVEVSDPLPACTSYQSDDCGAGEGDPFTWTIGELAVETSASCTVVVDATACAGEGEQTNTATATAEQADPVPDNDSGEATFEIEVVPALPALALVLLAALLALAATRLLRRNRVPEPPFGG